MTPTMRLVITNSFGDVTDVTISLKDDSMESVYDALRSALMGCGFAPETVNEYLPDGCYSSRPEAKRLIEAAKMWAHSPDTDGILVDAIEEYEASL